MKYSILAAHQDDEFIGCRSLIYSNLSQISNVIFLTNGEICVNYFVGPEYAIKRRKEASAWLKSIGIKNIHYLNVPDTWDEMQLIQGIGHEEFLRNHGSTRAQFLVNRMREIVKDDVIVCCRANYHPSHILLKGLAA